jgi:hypothetical protein
VGELRSRMDFAGASRGVFASSWQIKCVSLLKRAAESLAPMSDRTWWSHSLAFTRMLSLQAFKAATSSLGSSVRGGIDLHEAWIWAA